MTRNYKKPGAHQQFTISAENTGHLTGKPKKKPAINEYTEVEAAEFNKRRKEGESTWSKIDRATIDRQCNTVEWWDE